MPAHFRAVTALGLWSLDFRLTLAGGAMQRVAVSASGGWSNGGDCAALVDPTRRAGNLNQMIERKRGRLPASQDGANDVKCEEGERELVADPGTRDAFSPADVGD